MRPSRGIITFNFFLKLIAQGGASCDLSTHEMESRPASAMIRSLNSLNLSLSDLFPRSSKTGSFTEGFMLISPLIFLILVTISFNQSIFFMELKLFNL